MDIDMKILEKLFYIFNDDLKDSMEIFRIAKFFKMEGEHDLASYALNRAKQRIEMAEHSKQAIDKTLSQMQVKDSPYKVFYEEFAKWHVELKKEIYEFRI